MKTKLLAATAAFAIAGVVATTPAFAKRDEINIVGSSTVFPFATAVADKFGKKSGKTPKIVSTGSGGGMKLFCKGVGEDTPDITNASRRMKASEFKSCQEAGVKDISEVVIGFDGIVIANDKGAASFALTREQVYLALAAKIPGADGKLIANPNTKWSDIDASLPAQKIEVLGPPPSSGTRDAFEELALGDGAKHQHKWIKELSGLHAGDAKIKELVEAHGIDAKLMVKKDKKTGAESAASGKDIFKKIAYHIREDGAYIEAGENDNKIVDQLQANPNAVGVFGFSFLDQNKAKIKGASIGGHEPSFDNIASGKYPVSRSLYFYVKKAHVGVIPGIQEYVAEFMAKSTSGDDGYLVEKGLIPLPAADHEKMAASAAALAPMTGEGLK